MLIRFTFYTGTTRTSKRNQLIAINKKEKKENIFIALHVIIKMHGFLYIQSTCILLVDIHWYDGIIIIIEFNP